MVIVMGVLAELGTILTLLAMSRRRRATIVALLAIIVLSGCRLEHQGAAEPAWPHAGDSDPTTVDATPIPTRPDGRQFGDLHHYRDGLDVRVVEIRTAMLGWFPNTSDENAKDGDPYTIIIIQLDNNSQAEFTAAFAGKLMYGPELKEAGTVGLNQATAAATVAPGDSTSHDFGFLVPDEFKDDVVFELSIDIEEHKKAYFVGTIRTT